MFDHGKVNRAVLIGGTLIAACGLLARPANAEIIKYCLVAQTANETDAGTDRYPDVEMSGSPSAGAARISTGFREIGGDQDRNSTDVYNFQHQDMGIVTKIQVRKSNGNDWKLQFIKIYRGVYCSANGDPQGTADGWTQFWIDQWIEGETYSFNYTDFSPAKVAVSPEGVRTALPEKLVTAVDFYDNTQEIPQSVNLFKETFSSFEQISVSEASTNEINTSATVGWSSPQTVAGEFTGEASVGWSRALSEAQEQSRGQTSSVESDSQYTVAPRTALFRKQAFSVPYEYQAYRRSDNGKQIAVRMLGGPVRSAGFGQDLSVPRTDRDGEIVTVGLADLEQNWFPYMNPEAVDQIRNQPNLLPRWQTQGWVVNGMGGQLINLPAPPQQPGPDVQQPPVNNPVACPPTGAVRSLTTLGVNGPNLSLVRFGDQLARFEQSADGTYWQEYNVLGEPTSRFRENRRDDWSVYLTIENGGIDLQLDVHRKMIRLAQNGQPLADQWAMTEAMRLAP